MSIPNIPLFKVFMSPNISKSLEGVLSSGMITQGKQVETFENNLKSYFSFDNILTLNSATSGLTLSLRLLNLPKGSEVLSCPLTCTATNFPILCSDLKIKWVDVDPLTCNMNLDDLKNKITSSTRAVMVVFWGGYPVDLDKLEEIKKYTFETFGNKLHIIQDCAHAFGSKYKNKFIGTHSINSDYGETISVFSLQAIKHLTTGDGGLIFLPNKELYDRAKLLRWYGIDRDHRSGGDFRLEKDIPEWGYKFHMNDISATIGIENLNYMDNNISIVRDNAKYYRECLSTVDGVTLLEENIDCMSSYWIFTIKLSKRSLSETGEFKMSYNESLSETGAFKNEFIQFMKNKGVMVSQVHNRNDIHSCVKDFKCSLPLLDTLENEIVSIPVGWWVSKEDREYIVKCIKKWCLLNSLNKILDNPQSSIRDIEYEDYNKGFLKLMSELHGGYTKEVSFEEFKINQDIIKDQHGYVFVIEFNNTIIASAKLVIEYKTFNPVGHIEDVVVHPKYRGVGLAQSLLEKLKFISKECDCYKTILDCSQSLDSFYEKNDFKKVGSSFRV